MATTVVTVPPVARKEKHEMEMFGDVRVDNYYWLWDDSRSNPEILSHLQAESSYVDFVMSGTKEFEDNLYKEIRGRIKEDDVSVPVRRGDYYYYVNNEEGTEYVQHCRRLVPNPGARVSHHDTMPTGPCAPAQHVILDENVQAEQYEYYSIDAFNVSPNNKLVAYAEDTKGNEIYTLHIIDAETRQPVEKPLVGVTSYVEWAGDEALVYITMDGTLRADKVWLHKLGTEQSSDKCLYHEKDDKFSLDLVASESKRFLFVSSESKTTRFVFSLDISKPNEDLKVLTPRVEGESTYVSHWGDHFFIQRRNDVNFNSELLACPLDSPKEKPCIDGRSAGALLIGAVVNMRPDLFKAVILGVPFVDVLTTMLDPTIPLTTSEWEEWGDPREQEFYFYMKSYSPVDNVKVQNYPHMLVTAGLNDPRVMYSEPAKLVVKLRDLKADDNLVLFRCEFGAGHFTKSGRFEKLREDAFIYTFLLKTLYTHSYTDLRKCTQNGHGGY